MRNYTPNCGVLPDGVKENSSGTETITVRSLPTEIRQWTDADGRYPFKNCRHTRYDQVLSERNPITVRSIALQTVLSGLSCIVFCNCLYTDVGIIDVLKTGLFRNGFGQNGSQSTRSGCNLNSISRKKAMSNFSRSFPFHRTPSRIHRTLLGFWSDTAESVTT